MRRTCDVPAVSAVSRRRLLVTLPAGLTLIAMAALAGCSGGAASAPSSASAAGAPHAAVASGAIAAPEGAAAAAGAAGSAGSKSAASGAGAGQDASGARLAPAGQQLIYTAQLTVRARDVSSAVSRAASVAAAAGGYVSSENASSDQDHPAQATATVQLKIPVAVYAVTLAQLSGNALGTQLSLQQQTQDVTEQVADVSSQVASDEAAISQLRALLSRAGSVGDLLSVQDQINSEESSLEAMQAEQSALNHETAFATVTITIIGPKAAPAPKPKPKAAPGLRSGLSGGWHAFRVALSWLLAIIGAAVPFAAVVVVIGLGGYLARRRLAGRVRAPGGGQGAGGDSPATGGAGG
jgi:Domain of unknown function (DUF4349)